MRLKITCLALLASAATCLGTASVAAAAKAPPAAPTATARAATSVTNVSAVLNATVNPNGAKTSYTFSYGPTAALGIPSATKNAGAGTKATTASYKLTGLLSGTTYYYNLTATSTAGTVTTKTVMFTTAGPAPAQAQTGGAVVLSDSSAELTGIVNTQDTTTEYYFLYGPTAIYGSQTTAQTLTPSTSPSSVSFTLPGLAPGATFHYALVAVNGPGNKKTGADATFETFPNPAPHPKVVQYTTPKSPKRGPYVFTTKGTVENDTTLTPDSLACTGTATASFYYGKKLIHRLAMPIGSACEFYGQSTFKTLPVKGIRDEKLLVYLRFSGNHYLGGVVLKPETLVLGGL
jgi:hypothetical protein